MADTRRGTTKATIPQELADAWTDIMVEAVRYFHEPDFVMLPAMDYTNASDEAVKKRISGYQDGYDMEYMRRVLTAEAMYAQKDFDRDTKGYDFSRLPWPLQRAVVSHWDRLHQEFLNAHEGLAYYPKAGYVWLFKGDVHVPYRDSDNGKKPEEDDLIRQEGHYGDYGGHFTDMSYD